MPSGASGSVGPRELVLSCRDLAAAQELFVQQLGFRLETVFPADDPRALVLSREGLRVRLERLAAGAVQGREWPASAAAALAALAPLRPGFTLTRRPAGDADAGWTTGRAGMQYRDLIPGRQGGHLIASHIRIPGGGPVPDYVHFHRIAVQLIVCVSGWVSVAYEGQGPPLVMRAGDCVLQPPEIRHRVLECSPGLQVVEVTCPAEHETCAEHELTLPGPLGPAARRFGGQRFVFHRAEGAVWEPWRQPGFLARDTGIASATDGLADARIVRVAHGAPTAHGAPDVVLRFVFVLQGGATLHVASRAPEPVAAGDAFLVPQELAHSLASCSDDLHFLEVALGRVMAPGPCSA